MPGHKRSRHLLPLSLLCATTAWGDCDDYYIGDNLYYIGRTTSQSVWVSNTQAVGNYALNAPGFADIDNWSSSQNSQLHLSISPVVADGPNGTHQLQILGVSGNPAQPNCFVASRGQVNPIIPPTWRPPQKPVLPIKPERPTPPDRPVVVRPGLPELPIAVRPTLPERPAVVRPGLPELPIAVRPTLPDRPSVVRPVDPELPAMPQLPALNASQAPTELEMASLCPSIELDESGQPTEATLQRCAALAQALQQAPLTPGRDLPAESLWNAWVDPHYIYSSNRRGISTVEEETRSLSTGIDRRMDARLAVGALLSINDLNTESFDGNIRTEGTSYNLGPYLAYQLSPAWSLFANATIGKAKMERQILMFKGDGDSTSYGASLNLYGDFSLSETTSLRPKLGINYQKEDIDDYTLKGQLFNVYLEPEVDGLQQESGQALATFELNTLISDARNQMYIPYIEAGAYYNYLQDAHSPDSQWQGLIRGGLRTLMGSHTQIDINLAYESVGVSGLDVWNVGLFVSHGF